MLDEDHHTVPQAGPAVLPDDIEQLVLGWTPELADQRAGDQS